MSRISWSALLLIAAAYTMAPTTVAQPRNEPFVGSDIPDLPPPVPAQPAMPSLYEILSTGPASPLGTPVSSVSRDDLFAKAGTYLSGKDGDPRSPDEAEFWLKRAITIGADPAGNRRSWGLAKLAELYDKSGTPAQIAAATQLWELAAAGNFPDAFCRLGQRAERGMGPSSPPDAGAARQWFTRGKAVGCSDADAGLVRLAGR